jgi:redox-sensitive bicupin YhaK (pirin superfamily)
MEPASPVEAVILPRAHDVGGFEVRRALPAKERQMVGPFIFFDQMGPGEFLTGKGLDVRPHPHIGLSTVTYLFDGEILHRDSLGSGGPLGQPIRPGDVNWMTAGRGIAHSERTDAALRGQVNRLYGIQSWVALPKSAEEAAPDFAITRRRPAGGRGGRDAAAPHRRRGLGPARARRRLLALVLRRCDAGARRRRAAARWP